MSHKKNKIIRKKSAEIASKMRQLYYFANVGTFVPAVKDTAVTIVNAPHGYIKYTRARFAHNMLRIAKKTLANRI